MDPVPHFPAASSRKKVKPAYNKRLFGSDYMEFLTTVVPVHHVRRIDAQHVSRQNNVNAIKTDELIETFRPNRLGDMQPSNGSLILGRY